MKDILKHIFHSQSLKAEFSVGKSQRVSAKRGEGEGGGAISTQLLCDYSRS